MHGTERKKSAGGVRWAAPSSTMKTPTRPRFTFGGTQINSSSKNDFNAGGQARFSIGGAVPASARRHSVFRSLTSNFKDTRPLSSKEYQSGMIRTIYDFLLEHDGDNCLPERVIRSPTKQDFICMFESIYQHLSPDFQLKNVIEEVPAIFRDLGYPTAIKPSTMQTIGAAHSWPTLLGALTWLIDIVNVSISLQGQVGQELLLGGDDSSGTLKAYKYSWLNAGFKEYVQDRDTFKDENAFDTKIQALRQWHEQQEDYETQAKTIQANLEQISEECKELEGDKGKVERIQEDIARLDDDIAKASEYKKETDQHEKELAESLNAVNLELAAIRGQADEHRAKLTEVEDAIKAQEEGDGLCGTEARALIAELDQSKLTIRKLKAELEDLCRQHWLAVPKTKSALAEQQDRYHKLVMEIRSLYANALSDDTLMINENPEDARALYAAVLNDSKSILEEAEAKLLKRKWDLEQKMRQATSQAESIRQEGEVISAKLRDTQRMESRAERQHKRDREDWEKDVFAAETEIERLENEKEVLENKRHEIGSLRRDLESLRTENAEYSKILAEKQMKISDAVLTRFHIIVSDLDMMKEAREWMIRTMQELINMADLVCAEAFSDEGFAEN
ncbi:hypothetical protein GCK32_010354 [Trichostrongylus colubriformis]|uniref:Kinetochore protein NDC80 n=1 Tax=Trichostrongylus colubriformis TaxID=6319 RepID=A0AAN8ITG4_TRICO